MNITLSSQLVEQIKSQDQWGELSGLYRGDFSQHPVGKPMSLPLRVVRLLAQEKVFDPKDLSPADRVLVDTARPVPQKMGKARVVMVGKKGGKKGGDEEPFMSEVAYRRLEPKGYVPIPEELRVVLRGLLQKTGTKRSLGAFAKRHGLPLRHLYRIAEGRNKLILLEELRAIEGALHAGPDAPPPLPKKRARKEYKTAQSTRWGYEVVSKELRGMLTELKRQMPLIEFSRRSGVRHDMLYRIQNGKQKLVTTAAAARILTAVGVVLQENNTEILPSSEADTPIPFRVSVPTPSTEPSPQAGFTLESLFERFVEQSEKLQAAIQANQELLKEHAATLNRACDALVQAIPAQNRA